LPELVSTVDAKNKGSSQAGGHDKEPRNIGCKLAQRNGGEAWHNHTHSHSPADHKTEKSTGSDTRFHSLPRQTINSYDMRQIKYILEKGSRVDEE
jgi:hypothetical protein